MTNLLPFPNAAQTAGDIAQAAGSAPLGSGAMQGNPKDTSDRVSTGGGYDTLPGPQVGGAGQTLGTTPATHDLISRGAVPLSAVPTSGVLQQTGTDSLLAQMSRGQVSLNQSNYGQPAQVPKEAGTGPQPQPTAQLQPLPSQAGSSITVGATPSYTGN
jgi:hypothetical protein